jgi:DNA-binding winged helix-turn-helix (wHTH) protein/tetratricopeptide (TPR) repeat protein
MVSALEIRFDGWTLYRQSGELVRNGTRIRLQVQPLQVLEALLERPGELVTREQLIARLWPRGVVDFDTALNSAVHRLRVALGDHADAPRCIETIPRRGYRFIGRIDPQPAAPTGAPASEVDTTVAPAAPAARRTRAWPIALAIVLGLGGVATVGSLPFGGRHADSLAEPSPPGQAQERFLLARHFLQRRAPGDIERARILFTEALEIDPGFARAWSGLASAYWLDTVEGRMPPEQGLSKMRDAAERALELDPTLAEAHLRLAFYRGTLGDLRARDEHVQAALALDPDDPLALGVQAGNAAQDGRLDEAIEIQRRAVAAEPLAAASRYNLASFLMFADRHREAKAELLELNALHPVTRERNDLLGVVLVLEGEFAAALEAAAGWSDAADNLYVRALALHGLGREAESVAALQELIASTEGKDVWRIAEVHAYRGEDEQAFAWLNSAHPTSPTTPWQQVGGRSRWLISYSPFLKRLHTDPRWHAWLESGRAHASG